MKRTMRRASALMCGAAVLTLMAAEPALAEAAHAATAAAVSEVIVTATKRPEKVRSIAGSVTAVTNEQLQLIGAQSLQDYIATVPGVQFNNYQPGNSPIVIRGVSTTTYQEQGQTVTGYYINDIPLAEPGFSIMIPDVDTFDLNNVEVLRGPQGTLFGSSSLGGLVDYITNPADPRAYHAAIEAGVDTTYHAPDAGGFGKVMINAPLIKDELALRVVGLYRSDPGYIDNIATGVKGANALTTYGGRLSLVWTPTDKTKLTWLSMYELIKVNDGNYLTPGTLTRDTAVPNAQTSEVQLHSLKLEQDVGFADLTAIGAYTHKQKHVTFDDSIYYPGYLGGTVFPSPETAHADSEYAELRLAGKPGHMLDWVVGANYYTTNKLDVGSISTAGAAAYIDAHPADFGGPNMGQILAPNDEFYRDETYTRGDEEAIFGEASLHFTPEWTLTAGGRVFRTASNDRIVNLIGAFGPGYDFHQPNSETGFVPKASLTWKPNPDFMIYALYSQGYRFGGPNPVPPSAIYHTPLTYGSDHTANYETGVRTNWFDHRLELDVTGFFIDWTNIQVRLFRPDGFAYVLNAGGAHNYGVELTSLLHVTKEFDLQTDATYLDARLSAPLGQCGGCGAPIPSGTVLPGASKWQVMNIANFHFDDVPLHPQLVVTNRYISTAPVALLSKTQQGGYDTVGARLSVMVHDDIQLSLFAENLNDSRGVTAGPFADFTPAVVIIRPRTVGVSLDWKL